MKGTIKVLNASGHTATEFDTDKGVVKEAEEILAKATSMRSGVFDGKTKERVPTSGSSRNTILQENEEILVVPPMAGG